MDRPPLPPRVSEREGSPARPRGEAQSQCLAQQDGEVSLRSPLVTGSAMGQGQPVAKRKEAVCATRTEEKAGKQRESELLLTGL